MIKLFLNLHRCDSVLTSQVFDERTFEKQFSQDLRRAKRSIIIDSPYLTERRSLHYASLFRQLIRRRVQIRINTRNINHHNLGMRTQALKALHILLDAGVNVFTYDDQRHFKLAAIDKTILWEGSLNIMSHNASREIMRRSDSPYLCRQMIRFAKMNH